MREPREVVVLGAGVAGLACAVRLVSLGAKVTLIEGRRTAGGRAASFVDEASGEILDNGQHLFMSCYHDTLAFLRAIGTESLIRFQPRLQVEYLDPSRRSRLSLPSLPSPWDLVAGVLRLPGLSFSDRKAFLTAGPAIRRLRKPGSAAALESISVTAWLDRMGQPARLRQILWHPLTLATLNESPDAAPASLLARVLQEGFLAAGRAATLGLATTGLSELYADPAIRWLRAHGADVRLGEPVTRLVVRGGRLEAVEVRGGEVIATSSCVSTLPPAALSRLSLPLPGLDRFETSPILSINLWLDRPLSAIADFDFAGLLSGNVQWLFNRERILGGKAHNLAAVISAARSFVGQDNESLAAMAWRDIEEHLPSARSSRVIRSLVVRERNATFAATVAAEPYRPGPKSPWENLVLAGDWTMRGMPATIESAARSGHLAAAITLGAESPLAQTPAPS